MPPAPSPPVGSAPSANERFPGPADFVEGYATQPDPVLNGLQSMYTGTVVVTMMDRTTVANVLPPGYRLASPVSPTTRHPIIHLVGDQLEPATVVAGHAVPVPAAPGYREMILLVPYVVRDGGSGMYSFSTRMFLNSLTAVAGGNEYGYAKVFADLDRTDASPQTNYQVTTPDRATTWVVNEINHVGAWTPSTAYPPRWPELREIFRMPILGLRAADVRPPAFICSYWEWDFAEAELQTVTSTHRFVTRFVNGADGWVAAGPLASAPEGAFAMRRVRWRLAAPPTPC